MFDNKWEEIKEKYTEAYSKWIEYFLKLKISNNKSDVKYYYSEISDSFKIEIGERIFNIPFEMLYGLLEEFFDKNNIIIIISNHCSYWKFYIKIAKNKIFNYQYKWDLKVIFQKSYFKTRDEAKIEAIKKAFEIKENQLKE